MTGNFPKNQGYSPKQPVEAPAAVLIGGFYEQNPGSDGKRRIKKDLFDKTAEAIAGSFHGKDANGRPTGVSNTQLRRLFDEVKRFDRLLDAAPGDWERQWPYIRMIKSKVQYTVARDIAKHREKEKFYRNLAAFIREGIDTVSTWDDYRVFVALFEAVYGFYYEHAPKEN